MGFIRFRNPVGLVRSSFWAVGLVSGAILAYTTRHFTAGDAIWYTEMGEGLASGQWDKLLNTNVGPLYSMLLGLGQVILGTDPFSEVPLLKVVNFLCFMVAMLACDILVGLVLQDVQKAGDSETTPFPSYVVMAAIYGVFLLGALALVRVRLTNPDMLTYAFVLFAAVITLSIRERRSGYGKSILLGIVMGLGYLCKSYLFVFSLVFFAVALLCVHSALKGVRLVSAAVVTMLIVSAPYIAFLYERTGKLTYGDVGSTVYALSIASTGEPKRPEVLHENPRVNLYRWNIPCTRPFGFDQVYWLKGLEPVFTLSGQVNAVIANAWRIVSDSPWLVIVVGCLLLCGVVGSGFSIGGLREPSLFWTLALISAAGIGMFCIVRVESRYLPPFLTLGCAALAVAVRLPRDRDSTESVAPMSSAAIPGFRDGMDAGKRRNLSLAIATFVLLILFGQVVYSVVDQSLRALIPGDTKPSYRQLYFNQVAAARSLRKAGLQPEDDVAVLGNPPFYWARMLGTTVVAEIHDSQSYFRSTDSIRNTVHAALAKEGITALIGKDPRLEELTNEGWQRVAGTFDFYALFLEPVRRSGTARQ